jgi:hypothetical protein
MIVGWSGRRGREGKEVSKADGQFAGDERNGSSLYLSPRFVSLLQRLLDHLFSWSGLSAGVGRPVMSG